MKYLTKENLAKLKAYWDKDPCFAAKKPWYQTPSGKWMTANGHPVPPEALLVAELTEN